MVDLKKTSDDTELIRNELRELTATNQRLNGELETVRYKLNGEIDLLSYRLEKLNSDTQEIRREVYDLRHTIEHMHSELLRELNRNGRVNSRDLPSTLPLLAVAFPAALTAMIILFIVLATS